LKIAGMPSWCPNGFPAIGNGLWTGHDWVSTAYSLKVTNGAVMGTSNAILRLIAAATPLPCNRAVDFNTASNNPDNVKRVMRLLTSGQWTYLFPVAKTPYTYEAFIQAVERFPMFCNEISSFSPLTLD
jgi:hypothetical protein